MLFSGADKFARIAGAAALVCLVLIAVHPGWFAPFGPGDFQAPYMGPDGDHWLGTNAIGQDTLSLLIFSARNSWVVGLLAALLATTTGALVGMIAGYFQDPWDEPLMRLTDLFLLLPGLPLMILLSAYLNPGAAGVVLVIALTGWAGTARVVRASVRETRDLGFVRGARVLGAGHFYILARHVLPNVREIITAKALLAAAGAMVAEAGLSFLGLSDPGMVSWGTMLHDAFTGGAMVNGRYWEYLPPVGAIAATVLGVSMLAHRHEFPVETFAPAIRPAPASGLENGSPDSTHFAMGEGAPPVLEVENLTVDFTDPEGNVHRALDGVDLELGENERVAIAGTTGSGKSVLLLAILGLLPGNARFSGTIRFKSVDLTRATEEQMERIRGLELAYVPQGGGDAFNPLFTVGSQIAEPAILHRGLSRRDAREEAISLLAGMGFQDARQRARDYPHRYSGGMIQRALLAAAMTSKAPVLLVDEPTKGLDPASRREVLGALRRAADGAALLVTHDLAFAREFATRIVIMQASRVVEIAATEDFFERPLHPYSKALMAAQPERGMRAPDRIFPMLERNGAAGCCFYAWCDAVTPECLKKPPLIAAGGRRVRCWRHAV